MTRSGTRSKAKEATPNAGTTSNATASGSGGDGAMTYSPTSVLPDDEAQDVKPDILSDKMAEEEKRMEEERIKEAEEKRRKEAEAKERESAEGDPDETADSRFSKLDKLLSQTQLYSEFLLEKMHNMAENADGQKRQGKRGGKASKRKHAAAVCDRASKRVKEMADETFDVEEEESTEGDKLLTEEERIMKEQMDLCPLFTGGTLKSYQLKGVKWLISLWQNGLNGILADQMGLGKTVQSIGLLAHLKGKGMHGPFLICAPLSTLSNWVNEFKRWTPAIPVILYHGTKDERADLRRKMPASITPKFPVVVTSYEVAIHDRRFLCRRKWKYIIVDEGHRLKNFDCKLIRELKLIPTENTLLLTGTPLQNNLTELWSLLNFILPEIFTSLQQFESWFDLSGKQSQGLNKEEIDEKRRLEVVNKLHMILRPFLLRRLKEEVEKNMPLKKEIIFYAPMTEDQMKFQKLLIDNTLNEYFEGKSTGGGFKSRLNNVVMQLRKNSNHPDLLASHFDDSVTYPPVEELLRQCGKLKLLERLLLHLKARGHKVLIFSQMTRMLDILEYYLQERGMEPCRIDGKVKLQERQEQIQDFNNVENGRFIFLLSTRAGGLGINLTSADTVIIYDSDWNPHMDLQAMDRCHRIGQNKPVHVYRLVTAQSVECKMIKVANSKMQLEHVVIEKGQFKQEQYLPKTKLEESDLLALLRQERNVEEEYVQSSEISETDLLRALDRTDLFAGKYAQAHDPALTFPLKGPGWEVVVRGDTSGQLLSSIEGYRKFPLASNTEVSDSQPEVKGEEP
ncbi:hypothetical protein R1sor_015298 [Riccia sorocarpa]|uniref:Uncharacterized protein n=1 Tax=Riccia sorocarpa TaxID=122646 RepID=A0ABD3HFQ4_9MARC